MTPWLDSMADEPAWLLVPGDIAPRLADEAFAAEWLDEHDGKLDRIGVDDHEPLTVEQALAIAETYDGGEFDDEAAGIVAALCVLRDAVKAGRS